MHMQEYESKIKYVGICPDGQRIVFKQYIPHFGDETELNWKKNEATQKTLEYIANEMPGIKLQSKPLWVYTPKKQDELVNT
jgi:hypothetical protein